MKKLIYSRQFPALKELDVNEGVLIDAFARIVEQTKDEFKIVPLPERAASGEKFIPYPEDE